ncbi:LysE/ArgO family amino acid transporter [Williamsia limnetica]|uniref:LysE/ArgO family amino acid transporter n=1 Tax=Williamsia limnetica TaxID=882452 RepID=UPI000D7C57BE|nr:LysE/ArgO family amino acid transporter [Williamsia limnetica]
MTYFVPALAGLLTGAGLIIAIGAQNVFVLRQGIRREHVMAVVAVCTASDIVLILGGVAGLGALVTAFPEVVDIATIAGGGYLLILAAMAARRVVRPVSMDTAGGVVAVSRWAAIGTAVALTWLNPHVYLDTLITLGAIANSHGPQEKWVFAAGACVASLLWFAALGFGSARLAPLFAKQRAWQMLDALVAVVMGALGAGLILSAVF